MEYAVPVKLRICSPFPPLTMDLLEASVGHTGQADGRVSLPAVIGHPGACFADALTPAKVSRSTPLVAAGAHHHTSGTASHHQSGSWSKSSWAPTTSSASSLRRTRSRSSCAPEKSPASMRARARPKRARSFHPRSWAEESTPSK